MRMKSSVNSCGVRAIDAAVAHLPANSSGGIMMFVPCSAGLWSESSGGSESGTPSSVRDLESPVQRATGSQLATGGSRHRAELPVAIEQRIAGGAVGVLHQPDGDQVIAALVELLESADEPSGRAGDARHATVELPVDAVELVGALA